MALDTKNLLALAKATANANPTSMTSYSFNIDGKNESFSYADLNNTLRSELNELCGNGNYYQFQANQNTIFSLMAQTIDDVLPKKVLEQYGAFAEVQNFAQGDRPIFTQKITVAAKRRAKQFITKVGLNGIYEVFKLDGKSFEVKTSAFGGAAQIAFEEFLDGRVQMSDVLDIVYEGLDEAVYLEIERALKATVTNLPAANVHTDTAFKEAEMDKLISIADSYGKAVIYCTYEFAATMVPATGWVSDAMKDQKWNNGYLGNYKGHQVIVLNQSYEDETNSKKVIDPAYAWIIPTGAQKPVKIAFEGQTIVQNITNRDQSMEIQMYKKFGVGTIVTNNICVYKNSSLTR